MKEYEIAVGLEVHAELNTASKIYCSCRNAFGGAVNTRVCPVCMGLPGALPVLNATAVDYAIKMGHALHCRINTVSRQDRKHYFYPDLPKVYQISQAEIPLCEDGYLDFMAEGEAHHVRIQRIHIEEDAGKLLHDASADGSLIDFNRCGVPLIEIVTEPDIRSSSEAKAFLDTIRSILLYLGISDCRMQEGSIRCDVNVSVREKGSMIYGSRCEMKNVNSFSAAVRGIEYEAKRQIALLEAGGTVQQETRRWDDAKGVSILMRTKENAQDYRYFPEPDLRTIVVDEARVRALREEIPELPNEKVFRYVREYGLTPADAGSIAESIDKAAFFDACTALGTCRPENICHWVLSDIAKYTNDNGGSILDTCMTPERMTSLIAAVEQGTISNTAARTVFTGILRQDSEPAEIITALGLVQDSDPASLERLAAGVLAEQVKSVNDYRNGKKNALGFLVGQCMRASKGRANPVMIKEIVTRLLTELS